MDLAAQYLTAAKQLIYPNGVAITYSTVTTGAYNVETGTVTNTAVDTSIIAFPKIVRASTYNLPNLVGKDVEQFLIVATDLASKPKPQDKITKSSDVFVVDSVSEHTAGATVVIYKVTAVKS